MELLKKNKTVITFILLMAGVLLPFDILAHPMNDALSKLSRTDVAMVYFKLGFTHILPLGVDHILFVISIFLLNPKLKSVIWQATAFTVAHSITLGLAMYQVITPPTHIIEPIIALSIVFVAIENIITDKLKSARIIIVFIFGLIHGLGFASALTELGLPQNQFFISLITFNVGVEFGQITVILITWLLIGKWFAPKEWYRSRIVVPMSVVIAMMGLYWTIERTFFAT
ncbi:MAG: HupE/UreJ family protein [Burkholderiales bacterium]|nr:HupE/UreJ family protein [Bacteroidia bacterium]